MIYIYTWGNLGIVYCGKVLVVVVEGWFSIHLLPWRIIVRRNPKEVR